MLTCVWCGTAFESYPVINGVHLNLGGRKHCLTCLPLRRLSRPRRRVARARRLHACQACGEPFPDRVDIDGRIRNLQNRRFCLTCSPFGTHNTSRLPPGSLSRGELAEYRRKRRNANAYRYQKKHRREMKARLVEARGGKCEGCGYSGGVSALEFHHRDADAKDFAISSFSGSWPRLVSEAAKCVMLCANCHRLRHLALDASRDASDVVAFRRRTKVRAVAYMGGACEGCGARPAPTVLEFHHLTPGRKDFGIGQDGIPRPWPTVVAELAKCVMLCANCHREVHAGVRELDEGLLGLAEDATAYAA